MNHFQRLNEVKELKIFFFAQRANTRKQASSRRSLPCDAWAPTAQNRASAVRERHVSTQKTERSRLPGLIVGPCPSEESLCCPACPPAPPPPPFLFADSLVTSYRRVETSKKWRIDAFPDPQTNYMYMQLQVRRVEVVVVWTAVGPTFSGFAVILI